MTHGDGRGVSLDLKVYGCKVSILFVCQPCAFIWRLRMFAFFFLQSFAIQKFESDSLHEFEKTFLSLFSTFFLLLYVGLQTAYTLLKARRAIAKPNRNFLRQLIDHEKRLLAPASLKRTDPPKTTPIPPPPPTLH